jgi:hypothetical protein
MHHPDDVNTASNWPFPEIPVAAELAIDTTETPSGDATSVNPTCFYYTAYGLKIHSTLRLPELLPTQETKADVSICLGPLSNNPLATDSVQYCFQCTAEGMYLFWQGVGTFLIHEGKAIIVDPVPETGEDFLRLLILGAAMGVLLHQRGFLVLHASAVEVHGQAVVFIGNKGGGKSTLAATLQRRGHDLIADDVVAIDFRQAGRPQVLPAFPQLKLWPDAAAASLGISPEDLPRLTAQLEKRNHRLTQGFVENPLPLKHLYVLGLGSTVEVAPLQPQDVLTYLVRHSYMTRFGTAVLQSDSASHFLQLTQLARQVPVHHLLRPVALELLPLAAQLVEEKGCEDE